MNFASICRNLMIGVLAVLSLALVLFGTNAYADVKTINQCTVIDQPGSYRLQQVITATEGDLQQFEGVGACILVTVAFVTLDLQIDRCSSPFITSWIGPLSP